VSRLRPGVQLGRGDLARLMPMHMVVDAGGRITAAGPTLERLRPGGAVEGALLFDLFTFRRPHGVASMADLAPRCGDRLHLEFRDPPHTPLKGHFVADRQGLFVFDLSFGIRVKEAVQTHGLTATDFAPTSLAVEMLYLVEANAAAMAESRSLNIRLHAAKGAAERLAHTDALTGLRNRRVMVAAISEMAERGVPFSLLHVDLDFFKAVNDSLGHAAGDHVLIHVARSLEAQTRDGDLVIRLGGDEFVVVCKHMLDRPFLEAIAQRIIAALGVPIAFGKSTCRISASIGITCSDLYDQVDPERMLMDADSALYRSKRAGRSRVTFFGGQTLHPEDLGETPENRAGSGAG
jgi:diguanylate cyclase (GGDEF)-like protein